MQTRRLDGAGRNDVHGIGVEKGDASMKWNPSNSQRLFWLGVCISALAVNCLAQVQVVHSFGDVGDGKYPRGAVASDSTHLYAMTREGGEFGLGALVRIKPDGTEHAILHSWTMSSGYYPLGSLVIDDSNLYGMTSSGGAFGGGAIFRISADGSNYTMLQALGDGSSAPPGPGGGDPPPPNAGSGPAGSLLLSGTTLFGMSRWGGANDVGAVFSMSIDGSNYQTLHSFTGGPDGSVPYGNLILSGSHLYGMATLGGTDAMGSVFRLQADGSGFEILHGFTGALTDGGRPYGSLVSDDTHIYGLTTIGGSHNTGVLFGIDLDGTNMRLLHSFQGGATDGSSPYGTLTLQGDYIFGMTAMGGSNDLGTVFVTDKDGNAFDLLHSFSGGTGDGAIPVYGHLTAVGDRFYGITYGGGEFDAGTVFSLPIPEPSTFLLLMGAGGALAWRRKRMNTRSGRRG